MHCSRTVPRVRSSWAAWSPASLTFPFPLVSGVRLSHLHDAQDGNPHPLLVGQLICLPCACCPLSLWLDVLKAALSWGRLAAEHIENQIVCILWGQRPGGRRQVWTTKWNSSSTFLKTIELLVLCTCASVCKWWGEGRPQRTLAEVRSFLPPCWSRWGSNSGHQAKQQVPLFAEPFCRPPSSTLFSTECEWADQNLTVTALPNVPGLGRPCH